MNLGSSLSSAALIPMSARHFCMTHATEVGRKCDIHGSYSSSEEGVSKGLWVNQMPRKVTQTLSKGCTSTHWDHRREKGWGAAFDLGI